MTDYNIKPGDDLFQTKRIAFHYKKDGFGDLCMNSTNYISIGFHGDHPVEMTKQEARALRSWLGHVLEEDSDA